MIPPPAEKRHHTVERRNLAMHRAIAEKLRHHPELLEKARGHLHHWMGSNGRSTPYLTAWRRILELPCEHLLTTIQEDSERMSALRQYTPLAGLLSAEERWQIYAKVPDEQPDGSTIIT